jgi:hypothetical protein
MDPSVDLPREQRKVVWRALASAVFCSLALAAGYMVLPRYFSFPVDLAERLAFAIQADIFIFLWVVLAIRRVSRHRFYSATDSGAAAFGTPSAEIAMRAAFLQNTLEQAVIAVGAHLTLASLASGAALALIPASVALFAIGRLTFLLGYPQGAGARAFGMVTTTLPTIGLYGWALWILASRSF